MIIFAHSGISRFIPAYAGNSRRQFVKRLNISVHPRLRGELEDFTVTKSGCRGSSPLTRGTQRGVKAEIINDRFIPAYAGNSGNTHTLIKEQTVHPRLRGELHSRKFPNSTGRGSSPLTRGTHFSEMQQPVQHRFIPAYAGNSLKMVTTLH